MGSYMDVPMLYQHTTNREADQKPSFTRVSKDSRQYETYGGWPWVDSPSLHRIRTSDRNPQNGLYLKWVKVVCRMNAATREMYLQVLVGNKGSAPGRGILILLYNSQ